MMHTKAAIYFPCEIDKAIQVKTNTWKITSLY